MGGGVGCGAVLCSIPPSTQRWFLHTNRCLPPVCPQLRPGAATYDLCQLQCVMNTQCVAWMHGVDDDWVCGSPLATCPNKVRCLSLSRRAGSLPCCSWVGPPLQHARKGVATGLVHQQRVGWTELAAVNGGIGGHRSLSHFNSCILHTSPNFSTLCAAAQGLQARLLPALLLLLQSAGLAGRRRNWTPRWGRLRLSLMICSHVCKRVCAAAVVHWPPCLGPHHTAEAEVLGPLPYPAWLFC